MVRPYSDDLRERVAASVAQERSFRATAVLFGVSASECGKVVAAFARRTGTAAARPMGRAQLRSLAGERDWLLARLASGEGGDKLIAKVPYGHAVGPLANADLSGRPASPPD